MEKSDSDARSTQPDASGADYYSDGKYLRKKHQLTGTAGEQFVKWVHALIPSWTSATILDAGGGWGRFVWPLLDIYHVSGENIVLSDLSAGMLKIALEEAAKRAAGVHLAVCSIEWLPFQKGQFDIVMANHVLYHLGDIPHGVSELARVVRPDGCLLATTNSDKIVATIIALHYQALERLGIPFTPEEPSPFSMENGRDLFAARFRQVKQFYYEDERLVYDAAELRASYENIGRYRNILSREDVSASDRQALPRVVEQLAQEIIDREGVLRMPGLMGAFVCTGPY